MVIFGVFMFLVIILVGGIATDLMRHEATRARLQGAVDRSVLAAASMTQRRDPATVARDYFKTTRMSARYTAAQVARTNGRQVSANAQATTNTFFMRLLGVDSLSVPARSVARELVPNVEISLVLDISGSMRFSNRMTNLRPAAQSFVRNVLSTHGGTDTSINLVRYAGSTNPGREMFDYLRGERYPAATIGSGRGARPFPNVSSCLELPSSAMRNTALPPPGLAQVPHFVNWAIDSSVMDWGWCPRDEAAIIYASNSATQLNNAIGSMKMHDGTGTQIAMKWAVSLLDPGTQPAFAHLATRGLVPAANRSRPAAWTDRETAKYIVLMTDGEITEQPRPKNAVQDLNDTVELERSTRRDTDRHYLPNRGADESARRQSRDSNVNDFYALCAAAKARGITIFTIAFQIDPAIAATVRQQMGTCASSPNHFFEPNGAEISSVFNMIAGQINQLRLVQ